MAKELPTSLDYDDLLESFRTFLRGQEQFRDYNFDGSAINVLLRAMAYNSTMQAYSDNMLFNEGFLNTAEKYSSVASNASFLGYTPRSNNSARAKVNLTVKTSDSNSPATLQLTPEHAFITELDNTTYSFRPKQTSTAYKVGDTYSFQGVELIEGAVVSNTFVQQGSAVQSFVIPNKGIDTSTLVVRVYPSYTSTTFTTFDQFTDGSTLGTDKNIYFLEMNLDGYYQIEFGDGLLTSSISSGSVVYVEYRVGSAETANGASFFSPDFTLHSGAENAVTTVSVASGGSARESIESIKLNAKYGFARQGGLVSETDYVSFVKAKFGNLVDDVIAWGGDKMEPPKNGYVYLALKPKSTITSTDKINIASAMEKFNVGTITPVITDPVYTNINLDLNVAYTSLNSTTDPENLRNGVIKTVDSLSKGTLEQFNGDFILSDFIVAIKESNSSVSSLRTDVSYSKSYIPEANVTTNIEFSFNKQLTPGTVLISGFRIADASLTSTYKITDSSGVLTLYRYESGVTSKIKDIGTVDYSTGRVIVKGLTPTQTTPITCKVSPNYADVDFTPAFNEILVCSVSSCVVAQE